MKLRVSACPMLWANEPCTIKDKSLCSDDVFYLLNVTVLPCDFTYFTTFTYILRVHVNMYTSHFTLTLHTSLHSSFNLELNGSFAI